MLFKSDLCDLPRLAVPDACADHFRADHVWGDEASQARVYAEAVAPLTEQAGKLWHLSNITLQMWAASGGSPRDSIDDQIFERLRWPTLAKLGACLHDLGLAETAPSLYYAHDRFLHEISRVSVREELDALGYETRRSSAHYLSLRENARSLDAACEEVVAALWRIDRSHLIRFCLL